MGILKGVLLALAAGVCVVLLVVYGGVADVAASHPHGAAAGWLLDTAMERSVRRNASFVIAPSPLPSPEAGAAEYDALCAVCHGAPGRADSALARGLNPPPPRLAVTAADWNDAELFWIISNGVKMTGMPAWGATHGDEELWSVVSFLRALPRLDAAQYAAMVQAAGGAEGHARP